MRLNVFIFALLIFSSVHSATYQISGGNWLSQQTWNTSASGTISTLVHDNGESISPAVIANTTGIISWLPGSPPVTDGTYSGLLITDGSGRVIGGSLFVSGIVGNEVRISSNSWWAQTYDGLFIDFNSQVAGAVHQCYETVIVPATCASQPTLGLPGLVFSPGAGNEGLAGAAHEDAIFDGETLQIFSENYSSPGSGTDYLNTFSLTATLVPIPAAVWLFGSGLFGLLWFREKK